LSFKVDAAKTARGTLGFVIQNSANSLLGLVLFAVFARFVTKGEMGVYAGFTLTYTLFQTLGVLGLNIAATRFVAKSLAEGYGAAASAVARKIILISLGAGVIAVMIHYTLAPQFSFLISQSYDYARFFSYASIIVLVNIPMLIIEGLMQGVHEYGKLASLRIVAQVLRIVISVWLLQVGWGLLGMILGWTILGLAVLLSSIPFLTFHLDFRSSSYPLSPIFRYSLPMMGAALLLSCQTALMSS